MNFLKLSLFCMLCMLSSCVGCGRQQAEAEAEADAETEIEETMEKLADDLNDDLAGALNKVQDALKDVEKNLKSGEEVEVANFRDLKEILPKRMLGMERHSHTGEKSGVTGFKISQATAKYKDGDRRLEINIVDSGGMALASLGAAAWTMLDVDRETDDGYERTTTIDGYKAYEKFDSRRGEAEISIFYKDRFLVNIKGDNLKRGEAEKILNRLELDDLDDL
ncbi:MAG: transposase [Saprospiraceae bacterium]|nr:transposase [Saprospiraceae bacterium]